MRLRPITDMVPKPLVPIGDRPLLDIILANLAAAGAAEIAVNLHHLPGQMENAVRDSRWSEKVALFREREILGTGGPLVNAKNLLSNADAFILHNGDILTDANLAELVSAHFNLPDTAVTMLLIDGPENKVSVDDSGRVVDVLGKLGREKEGERLLTYAGISVFSARIFDFLPDSPKNYSIITAILDLMRDHPSAVGGYIPDGIVWNDLGTVERFVAARRSVETGALKLPFDTASNEHSMKTPLRPLPLQGSDRLFIRVEPSDEKETSVIMCAPGDEENFARFAKIAKFLNSRELGAPEIYRISEENQTLVMEDLGDGTLLSLAAESTDAELERLYEKVLRWLVEFQTATYKDLEIETHTISRNSDGKIALRLFDREYLLWESSYFAENYLSYLKGVSKSDLRHLEREFRGLADIALSHPQVMIHRDFQSSNILLKNGKVRIVDFQGARIGHVAYDMVSLIKDPYMRIPRKTRSKLMKRHFEIFRDSALPEVLESRGNAVFNESQYVSHHAVSELRDPTLFAKFAATASLQRNMQALGAFVFLARKKRRIAYERFIEPGAAILMESLLEFNDLFPERPLANLADILAEI